MSRDGSGSLNRPRIGVLAIRAWWEGDHKPRLVARLTITADVVTDAETTVVASSAEEICTMVRDWLEQIGRGNATKLGLD